MNTSLQRPLFMLARLDALLALLCFAGGLALYTQTLAPGLLYGDSAELQTLAYTLGMTHPTGYPVYLLAAKTFVTLLPLGEIAYRVNLLSAVFGASTLALGYLAGRMLSGWRFASLAGMFGLATLDLFWHQSIIAELYSAAAALLAAVLLFLLLWQESDHPGWLFAAGLLGGLSLGVHNTVALIAPAVILYLLVSTRAWRDWRAAIAGAVLGLSLTLAAFLALDAHDPPSSYYDSVVRPSLSVWGLSSGNIDTPFERLAFLFAARQFRGFMFSQPASYAWDKLAFYFNGWDWSVTLPVLLGLAALYARRWREALLLSLSWGITLFFIANYHVDDFYVFFVPTLLVLALVWAAGLAASADVLAWLLSHSPARRWSKAGAGIACAALAVFLIAPAIPAIRESIQAGYPLSLQESGDYPYPFESPQAAHQQAQAVVDQIEDDAIVFTGWDMLYAYYYVAHVEQGRSGIAFHETYPQDDVGLVAGSALDYIDANLGNRPIYITQRTPEFLQDYAISKVSHWPALYQLSALP